MPRRLITPPKSLTGEARAEWVRVAADLERSGLLDWADRDALARYAIHAARWEQVTGRIDREGMIDERRRLHPLTKEARRLARELDRLCGQLGMTPLSRAKIQAARALRDKRTRRNIAIMKG